MEVDQWMDGCTCIYIYVERRTEKHGGEGNDVEEGGHHLAGQEVGPLFVRLFRIVCRSMYI